MRASRLSATFERFAQKTSDSSAAHQRKTTTARITNYTAGRAPYSQPGETKETSSLASCCRRRNGRRPPPLCRTVRVRLPRPTPNSSHQSHLHCRASAGRLPRPRRPGDHPPDPRRRTSTAAYPRELHPVSFPLRQSRFRGFFRTYFRPYAGKHMAISGLNFKKRIVPLGSYCS